MSQEKSDRRAARPSSSESVVSKRSSRDPRLKKQTSIKESSKESSRDAVIELKGCCVVKKVSKMSIVEYRAREAVGKATEGKEKENSYNKAVLEEMQVQASADTPHAGQATPGGKRKRCHGDSKSMEELLMRKSVEEALNHQNCSKQADTRDGFENPTESLERASSCEETVEEEQRVKVERMLAELEQLSKEMEEEKEKSRRSHEENEDLDIELELILNRLK